MGSFKTNIIAPSWRGAAPLDEQRQSESTKARTRVSGPMEVKSATTATAGFVLGRSLQEDRDVEAF